MKSSPSRKEMGDICSGGMYEPALSGRAGVKKGKASVNTAASGKRWSKKCRGVQQVKKRFSQQKRFLVRKGHVPWFSTLWAKIQQKERK